VSPVNQWLNQIPNKKILVIGDSMLDIYFFGAMDRTSPEADVPILDVESIEVKLGGAANVAANIQSMNAGVHLFSITGDDEGSRELKNRLDELQISHNLIIDPSRKTTKKTRIYQKGIYSLRIDEESTHPISKEMEHRVSAELEKIVFNQNFDAVIFQDYNKGFFTKNNIEQLTKILNHYQIPIVVDPKKEHFFDYKNCTLFKPNLKELSIATGLQGVEENWETMAKMAQQKLQCDFVLLTLSEHGALLFGADQMCIHVSAHPRSIVDVSGAGDTVLAIATLALVSNVTSDQIVKYANFAGGIVCERLGVSTISPHDFEKYE